MTACLPDNSVSRKADLRHPWFLSSSNSLFPLAHFALAIIDSRSNCHCARKALSWESSAYLRARVGSSYFGSRWCDPYP